MKKIILTTFSGILISMTLFWLMQAMISNNQQQQLHSERLQMTEFIRLKRETRLQTKERNIPEPPPPKKRPPPPKVKQQQINKSKTIQPQIDMPNLDIPLQTSRFKGSLLNGLQVGQGEVSTNVIPLVRIPPRYPMRAANRRIEGWVKVEFTINTDGTVKNPKVVDSHPSDIFNRAALQAIKRWKFKAKIIDGTAFEQRAAQVLQFKMTK